MEIFSSKPINFIFNFNIEQVYRCFFCYNITMYLKKKGLLNSVNYFVEAPSQSEGEVMLDNPNTHIIYKFKTGEYKISFENVEKDSTFRKVKLMFTQFNQKPLDFILNIVFNFYSNTTTNSTLFSCYIESSKNLIDSESLMPQTMQTSVCEDLNLFLTKWYKKISIMESMVINISIGNIYKEIMNGSIFQLPIYKNWIVAVEKKKGGVGSSYLFMKKQEKVTYVIKSIEERCDCIRIIVDKKSKKKFSDKEIEFTIVKIDENSSLLQFCSNYLFPVDGYHQNLLQKSQNKILLKFNDLLMKKVSN